MQPTSQIEQAKIYPKFPAATNAMEQLIKSHHCYGLPIPNWEYGIRRHKDGWILLTHSKYGEIYCYFTGED